MIYLLDLNYTLVSNSEVKIAPFRNQIAQETYREWLVDLLKESGHTIILMTARPETHKRITMARIQDLLEWQPDDAIFNQGGPPPVSKEKALQNLVFPVYGRNTTYFGLESNPKTREMYLRYGIESCGVPKTPWTNLPIPTNT